MREKSRLISRHGRTVCGRSLGHISIVASVSFLFKLLKLRKKLLQKFLALIFGLNRLDNVHSSAAIYKVSCARSARDFAINSVPCLSEIILNALEAVKR